MQFKTIFFLFGAMAMPFIGTMAAPLPTDNQNSVSSAPNLPPNSHVPAYVVKYADGTVVTKRKSTSDQVREAALVTTVVAGGTAAAVGGFTHVQHKRQKRKLATIIDKQVADITPAQIASLKKEIQSAGKYIR